MKKLIPHIAAFFFAVFVLGVFAAMMLYSWQGLSNIFPADLLGQSFGMLMFDLAALIWFASMVYQSRSVAQYVIAFVGFMVGLVGTLGLIGIEVGLSSGMLDAGSMQKPLTYIFITVLVGHVVLIYSHHAAAPEMAAAISMGIEKAKITDRAEQDATRMLSENIEKLSAPIAQDLVRRVQEDLNLRPARGEVLDLPALAVDESPASAGENINKFNWALFGNLFKGWGNDARRYESQVAAPVEDRAEPVYRQNDQAVLGGSSEEKPRVEPLYHPDLALIERENRKREQEKEVAASDNPAPFREEQSAEEG
jgi:hypothetical protein